MRVETPFANCYVFRYQEGVAGKGISVAFSLLFKRQLFIASSSAATPYLDEQDDVANELTFHQVR